MSEGTTNSARSVVMRESLLEAQATVDRERAHWCTHLKFCPTLWSGGSAILEPVPVRVSPEPARTLTGPFLLAEQGEGDFIGEANARGWVPFNVSQVAWRANAALVTVTCALTMLTVPCSTQQASWHGRDFGRTAQWRG
jgi:hypothetical protein